MLCKNLTSWAGENFHHPAGAEIELDDETAVARCDAGLATADKDDLDQARRRVGARSKAKTS